MAFGISSHLFFTSRLNPGHLDAFHHAGADVIEVFASRHHFDYANRSEVRELATWFRSNPVAATMHMPIFTEAEESQWSRHTEPTLNLVSPAKGERIQAMDEVKRALEAAEQIPFRSCVLHLGLKEDRWSTETLDLSLTAIEHLKAFASPLGVQLLLENLHNDLATPAHLVEITRVGHFDDVGFCLDTGHAHLAEPMQPDQTGYDRFARERLLDQFGDAALKDALPEAFQVFGKRLVELHLHDNNGTRDEHAWPGDLAGANETRVPQSRPQSTSGINPQTSRVRDSSTQATNGMNAQTSKSVDWGIVRSSLAQLTQPLNQILEIAYDPATPQRDISKKASTARKLLDPQP